MKALSTKQPWAWLIVNGYKDIENRTWGTNVRGPILIHAGNRFDEAGYTYVKSRFGVIMPSREEFKKMRGGIVGVCEIKDCVTDSLSAWFCGPYGFVLAGGQPVKFIPYKGQLMFFNVRQKCRVCGCTEKRACPGGCGWVEWDLCSGCAGSRDKAGG